MRHLSFLLRLFLVFFLVLMASLLPFAGVSWMLIPVIVGILIWLIPPGFAGWTVFVISFLAGLGAWAGTAYFHNYIQEGKWSAVMGNVFMGLSSWQLIVMTGVLGGLLAGFGALTGNYAAGLFNTKSAR